MTEHNLTSVAAYSFEILLALTIIFGLLTLVYIIAVFKALKQVRLIKVGQRLTLLILFIPIVLLSSAILVGTHGYSKLTQEDTIGTITIRPITKGSFEAELKLENGKIQQFILNGDQVQVDANIIKWKPIANFLGLHTQYELSRISGRYKDLTKARNAPVSAYALGDERLFDLAKFQVQNHTLSFLMDAEYGSATFLPADQAAKYQLLVSTSGLMLRKLPDNA